MKRLGLVVLGLVLALLAVEIAFRATLSPEEIVIRRPPPEPSETGRWIDHPFLPFAGQSHADYVVTGLQWGVPHPARIQNNAVGFRTHEFPPSKPPGAYFVVALGGSTTWGALAATNDETWPALLEAKLRARYPGRDVRVFNLGTMNATLPYSLTALALNAAQLEPDLAIVYHGFNDYGPSLALGYRPDHAHHFRDLGLEQRWPGVQRSLPAWMLASYAVSYLTSRVDETLGTNRLTFYVNREAPPDPAVLATHDTLVTGLMRNWRHFDTIDALARGYGGHALFSTFQFLDGTQDGYREVNESLRKFFDANRLAYVDQDALIPDGDETLQVDACHFTDAGRELVAENFFRELVARGWLE